MKRLFPILLSLWTLVAFSADPTINGANIRAATLPITAIAPQPANTTLCNATGGSAVPTACDAATMRTNIGAGTGTGDASTNTATSVDGEITLFNSTSGKSLKRATGTGLAKVTSGVFSTATAGTDYYNPGGTDIAIADGGTGASLTDPNADRILFWDDSAGAVTWLTAGTGLTITGTTIDASGGGLTNFTEAVNTSAPNATVPVVSLTATNAATNVDIALKAKGTGALTAHIADNTSTGGNKRGARAVDWQQERSANSQVASQPGSTISGGRNNTASDDYATVGGGEGNVASNNYAFVAGGQGNTASGDSSFVSGNGNTASGFYSTAMGVSSVASGSGSVALGASGTANGTYSITIGNGASAKGIIGVLAHSATNSSGGRQKRTFILSRNTTDATPAALTTDAGTPGTNNQIVLSNNSHMAFHGLISVRENATGDSKGIEFRGAIKRGANAAATALQGAVTQADLGTPDAGATWPVAFTADTTNGCLKIEVTGEASHGLRWTAEVEVVETEG